MKSFLLEVKKWSDLFSSLPSNNCSYCLNTEEIKYYSLKDEIAENIAFIFVFVPSYELEKKGKIFHLYLRKNGTARFNINCDYGFPQLSNFVGTWQEAYLLLSSVVLSNWPVDKLKVEFKSNQLKSLN